MNELYKDIKAIALFVPAPIVIDTPVYYYECTVCGSTEYNSSDECAYCRNPDGFHLVPTK